MTAARWTALPTAALLLVSACTQRTLPLDEPDITGVITAVRPGDDGDRLGVIRVETVPEDEAGTPKASVTVTTSTDFEGAAASSPRERFAELREGQRVHVWFDGPVMESYPVQAAAGRIELERSAQ